MKRKVSSISAVHRLLSLPDPTKHQEVRITQRKIYRQLGTRFDQAYPITQPLLEKMLAVCASDLHGLRNQALLLTAYESMRRRSELVALRVEDIEWRADNSAAILLRRSKTDQSGQGKWIQLSARAGRALKAWLRAVNLDVGAAQDQLVAGAPPPQIMVKGGLSKPDTVMRYVERVRPLV